MSDPEHARMMLSLARGDLSALRGMNDSSVFNEAIFGFHAQQAVEKCLKAWLSLVGVAYPKVHELEELFALLDEHGASVPDGFRELQRLTDYAVLLRYEASGVPRGSLDRPAIVGQAEEIVEHVEKLLRAAT